VWMQDLVVKSIALAIARDGASGGVVRTVTVCSTTCFLLPYLFNVVLFSFFLSETK